jgi:hypothetical protein
LLFAALALVVVGAFWQFTARFLVPAHGGADQNGYLVGARNFAEHFSIGFKPHDEYSFVGRMWVAGRDGRFYPKYPPGMSVLIAGVWRLGPDWVYRISPALMVLALLAVFLLGRLVGGSLAGLLAMLIIASSPVTLLLANNPNSHAAALCLVAWGMYLLMRWMEVGGASRAVFAGLLLGFAVIIRYSEGLLVLPLVLAVAFSRRPWRQVSLLLAGWAVPIGLVLAFNHWTLGSLTGYAPTGESRVGEAFRWEYFAANWAGTLRQLNGTALFASLPIGVLGLLLLAGVNWRTALVLWAWLVPGLLLYTSYYWSPAEPGSVHYLRFFLTLFPPIAVAAGWALTNLAPSERRVGSGWRAAAAWAVVLGAGAYGVWSALPLTEAERERSRAVALAAEKLMGDAKAPAGSVVFGPAEFLNHLQFAGDYRLYATEDFDPALLRMLDKGEGPGPVAEGERRKRLSTMSKEELKAAAWGVMRRAIEEPRRVFVIGPGAPELGSGLTGRRVVAWTEGAGDSERKLPPARWEIWEVARGQ